MRVVFLYNRASEDPAQTADDDVPERSPVVAALRRLGHQVMPIACTLDLGKARQAIERAKPDVVFNRVESLGGSDSLIAAVTLLLDSMQLAYTGCPTEALVATASKLVMKQRLVDAGLPTPEWIPRTSGTTYEDNGVEPPFNFQAARRRSRFLLKSVYEHASYGMDDRNLVGPAEPREIGHLVEDRTRETGRAFFAERFIDGREFNLSVMGEEPMVLPPAEIDFSAFPQDKPRIVGFRAKWDKNAFEFHNTPRKFDFDAEDGPLLRRMSGLAMEAYQLFALRGFARIDFRCDGLGQPWILEINANPCLAPSSGFAAALEQAGIGYDEGIRRILEAAKPGFGRRPACGSRHPVGAS